MVENNGKKITPKKVKGIKIPKKNEWGAEFPFQKDDCTNHPNGIVIVKTI